MSEEILQKLESAEIAGQQATDFGFEPGTNIRSEIEYAWSRIKLDWKHFSDKSTNLPASDPYGTTLSRKWMEQFLSSLGFDLTKEKSGLQGDNNQSYTISHTAANLDQLPVHIVGFIEPNNPDKNTLDVKSSGGTSRLSPHATVQEYINVTEHVFGIASNGLFLRLIRDSGRLIKLTYVEFDLKRMLDEDKYSEFTLLYRLLHASRFPRTKTEADQCLLEKYYQDSIETGNRIRDGLSQAVKESLVALGNGLLNQPENVALREAYQNGQLTAYELNHQLLRLIYRLLFLIVTEERDLVYDSANNSDEQKRNRDIYYRYYSLARLRRLSANRYLFEQQYTDLWQGLMLTFSFFEPGNAGAKLGIHSLGGELFQPSALKDIKSAQLNNRVLLQCIRSLNEFEDAKKNRVLINFRSLDVEELGSIYEGLLELSPVIQSDGRQYEFTYEKGSERSSSGSHYTPEDLVKPLIQHSLEYLIEDRVTAFYKGKKTAEAAIGDLLSLKVADVACGSGHILLSAARRIAHEVARIESGEQQPNPQSFRKALKQVIRHCIYGVDKNPLAVELCKVALWLESHNPGEPLNFLDHHIKCGDAIVGLAHRSELENGIADEAFKTLPGDDKAIAKTLRDRNVKERKDRTVKTLQLKTEFEKTTENSVQEAMAEYKTFNQLPETTPEEIERKAKAYQKFIDGKGFSFLKAMADTQCAQFFIPKTEANKDYLMTDADYRLILSGYKGWQDRKVAKATAVAHEQRFFHWFIEFPEVFSEGGFDCVLGNPPFLGDRRLKEAYGEEFLEWIRFKFTEGATVDLVVYFFLRINSILRTNGFQSLISTNTVAQGKAREFGLEKIIANGSVLNHAVKGMKWPGLAAVEVSLITIYKGNWSGKFYLNGKLTEQISPFLDEADNTGTPYPLNANEGKSYQGSIVLGMGFVLEPNEAEYLILEDSKNTEVIQPYLNGDDLNNNPDQRPSRFVINFFDWPEDKAANYKHPYNILFERVKPERQRWKEDKSGNPIVGEYALRHPLPVKWWQHCEKRPALYNAAKEVNRVLVSCRVSKYVNQSFIEVGAVFDVATSVVIRSKYWEYAFLQSSLHDNWAWKYASTLESRIRYVNVDCIDTFPILDNLPIDIKIRLESIGEAYHEHRRQLMLGMQLGLTKTYNAFHNEECRMNNEKWQTVLNDLDNGKTLQEINIKSYGFNKESTNLIKHFQKGEPTVSLREAIAGIEKLRSLHVQMDEAVLEAYGWRFDSAQRQDIQLRHDFYEVDYLPENDRIRFTIHPDARKEVLKRLLELNHKIHEEEVQAGLWDKKKTSTKKSNIVNEPNAAYGGDLFNQE